MDPIRSEDHFRFRLYEMGGVLANAVLAASGVLALILTDMPDHWRLDLSLFVFVNLVLGLVNAIPFSKDVTNDGWNFVDANRSSQSRADNYRVLKIHAALSEGVRLRDVSPELFSTPSSSPPDSQIGWVRVIYSADRLNDIGDKSGASRVFHNVDLDKLSTFYAGYVIAELCYNRIVHQVLDPTGADAQNREPTSEASEHHPALRQYLKLKVPVAFRLKAATAFYEDSDIEQAFRLLQQARESLPGLGSQGAIMTEQSEIDALEARMKEAPDHDCVRDNKKACSQ